MHPTFGEVIGTQGQLSLTAARPVVDMTFLWRVVDSPALEDIR